MILVTRPFLPPKDEYDAYLNRIWQHDVLTNNGPLVRELEQELQQYLKVKNLLYVTNGTIALQISIKALGLKGEVITTPFSYVATTSSLVWEGCVPIFVDIDKDSLNINPYLIEDAITPRTSAILATHVYGNPCDVEVISEIAERHRLKIIYDAAHGFGSIYKGKSIYDYGDASTASFHATKLFHTVEGGAIVTPDEELKRRISLMRNFGHNGPEVFDGIGINGKNSEFHAAMGLVNLKYVDKIISKRRELSDYYDDKLRNISARRPTVTKGTSYNYSYYALQMKSEEDLLAVLKALNEKEIYPRRYFYPSLNELSYVNCRELPITKNAAMRALCLPLYFDLSVEEVDTICDIVMNAL